MKIRLSIVSRLCIWAFAAFACLAARADLIIRDSPISMMRYRYIASDDYHGWLYNNGMYFSLAEVVILAICVLIAISILAYLVISIKSRTPLLESMVLTVLIGAGSCASLWFFGKDFCRHFDDIGIGLATRPAIFQDTRENRAKFEDWKNRPSHPNNRHLDLSNKELSQTKDS